ncbi:MAG: Crp/Fnr family transcriptional regulator [Acidobacteria bacterium]|nr:Crp/Fnr family transcriptional regulator [Acidobacteriota bacterium]
MHYLSTVDLFRDLGPEDMEEIRRITTMKTWPAGTIFYSPDEQGEILFILKKGRVQLYWMSEEGKRVVLGYVEPHTAFGEMALTGQGMYDAFAEAVEESLICVMNRRDVEKLITAKPLVGIRLLDLMGKRLKEMEERLEQSLFRDVPSRLAALLLHLRAELGSDTIELTHEQVAERLGVYRETVTTALSNLRKEGLISIARRQIHVTNVPGLEKRAHGHRSSSGH